MKTLITICFILFAFISVAQNKNQDEEKLKSDAEFFTMEGEHEKAYQSYKQLLEINPDNYVYKFQMGLSALNLPIRKAETISIFEDIVNKDAKSKLELTSYLSKKYETVPLFYLGRAYHANYKFDEAIKQFNAFLDSKPFDASMKKEAQQYLGYAKSAIDIVAKPTKVNIKNIGSPINSPDHEYVPLITADEAMMLFTYRGPKCIGGLMNLKGKPNKNGIYFEDIYFSKKMSGANWGEPQSIGEKLNSKQHDACIAISPDGQDLYTYRSDEKDGGDIFVCHLKGNEWSTPERLNSSVNTPSWEGSCTVSSDGQYLYFASERPGGVGGRDIYVSKKMKNGTWGIANNLRAINTPYDDDAPFIHADGITLFFSSQGHNSIGGFDIFYTTLNNEEWANPINMGYPLNTTDDDRYYVINAKGDKGYFSSNRSSVGGDGSLDIYSVEPGWYPGKQHALVMIVGSVYGNDTLMQASIEVVKKSNQELMGPYTSNSTSGKYLIALPTNDSYVFKIKANGFDEYTEELDASKLSEYLEINRSFHLSKQNYKDPHEDTLKKLNDFIPKNLPIETVVKVDEPLKVEEPLKINEPTKEVVASTDPCAEFKTLDFSNLKGKSLNDPKVYDALLQIGNKICAKSMVFKVQVGAYKKTQYFKPTHLKKHGAIESTIGTDGITRFTQGKCNNVNEAEALRKKIIASGQTDAWIVGFIDGKRYTLEELIMVDFYNKNIVQYNEHVMLLTELLVQTTN